MTTRTLYKLTNKLGDYYVIAENSTQAVEKLEEILDAGGGYGFSNERKVKNIVVIAEEIIKRDSIGYPYILTDKFLIL